MRGRETDPSTHRSQKPTNVGCSQRSAPLVEDFRAAASHVFADRADFCGFVSGCGLRRFLKRQAILLHRVTVIDHPAEERPDWGNQCPPERRQLPANAAET